ncbi:MAG: hypothetical protein HY791_10510 [Deltaproteobacteria bacterium]|nr:hypothetical protein [Deltaproteobacteria bacterium]
MSKHLAVFVGLGALCSAHPVQAQLVVPRGTLEVQLGLGDHSINDSVTPYPSLGGTRGLTLLKVKGYGDLFAGIGIGGAYGVAENFEIETLLIPLQIAPDGNFGDIQLNGRYQFLTGEFSAAVQLAMQIPTWSYFGLGFGLPIAAMLGPDLKLLSGVELEVIFTPGSSLVNLDVPATFLARMSETARVGLRTGLVLYDFRTEIVAVPLGVVAEFDAGRATIVPAFIWPAFLNSDGVLIETFAINIGVRVRFDELGAS